MKVVGMECRPIPVHPEANGALLAVLTMDEERGWRYACYLGVVPYAAAVDLEARKLVAGWVAAHGLKVKHHECLNYFPSVPKETYRD